MTSAVVTQFLIRTAHVETMNFLVKHFRTIRTVVVFVSIVTAVLGGGTALALSLTPNEPNRIEACVVHKVKITKSLNYIDTSCGNFTLDGSVLFAEDVEIIPGEEYVLTISPRLNGGRVLQVKNT